MKFIADGGRNAVELRNPQDQPHSRVQDGLKTVEKISIRPIEDTVTMIDSYLSVYIPEVVRCYKCQKFGHKAPSCHARKEKCTVCSGPHEVQHCPIKTTHRQESTTTCPNCKGPHSASYQGCPEFKFAQQAQKKHILQKISYAEAVRRCKEEREEKIKEIKEKEKISIKEKKPIPNRSEMCCRLLNQHISHLANPPVII